MIFWLRSKFGIEKPVNFGLEHFFGKIKYIAVKIWLFLTIGVFNKDINTIKKLQEIMVIIFRTSFFYFLKNFVISFS